MNDLIQEQLLAQKARRNHAVATIVEAKGSTPRSRGKMLVYEDGKSVGTIGGGIAELRAKKDAVACIQNGNNAFLHYDIAPELAQSGMVCSGTLSVLIEVYHTKPLLVVCGAGHVGTCLVRIAKLTGFDVLLIDDRPNELIAEAVSLADHFLPVKDFTRDIQTAEIQSGAFFVIAGHSHVQDGAALIAALGKQAAYVGMLGSRLKIKTLFETLRSQGISDEQLSSVHTPIGLDLGGETPEEIAISIMSEILMVKNGRTGNTISAKLKTES